MCGLCVCVCARMHGELASEHGCDTHICTLRSEHRLLFIGLPICMIGFLVGGAIGVQSKNSRSLTCTALLPKAGYLANVLVTPMDIISLFVNGSACSDPGTLCTPIEFQQSRILQAPVMVLCRSRATRRCTLKQIALNDQSPSCAGSLLRPAVCPDGVLALAFRARRLLHHL